MAIGLDGAVVLVTGGANGIGAMAAGRLAARGARVVVADVDERGADVAAAIGGRFARRSPSRRPWPRTSVTPRFCSHGTCPESSRPPTISSRRAGIACTSSGR